MLRFALLALVAISFQPLVYAEPACRDFRSHLNEADSMVVVSGEGVLASIDYRGTADSTFVVKGTVCNLDLTPAAVQDLRLVHFVDPRPKEGRQALTASSFADFEKLDEFDVPTEQDGSFVVTGLPPGSYVLLAEGKVDSDHVVYDLRLLPGFTIPSSSALGLDPAPLSTSLR